MIKPVNLKMGFARLRGRLPQKGTSSLRSGASSERQGSLSSPPGGVTPRQNPQTEFPFAGFLFLLLGGVKSCYNNLFTLYPVQ